MIRLTQLLLLSVFISGSVCAQKSFTQTGDASFYSDELIGRYTASGDKYDTLSFTAAHMTLPFGTMAQVTNMQNGKSVVVKINDRGPFVAGRVIDLSKAAAKTIDLLRAGTVRVKIEVVEKNQAQAAKPEKKVAPNKNPVETLNPASAPAPKQTNVKNDPPPARQVSGLLKVNRIDANATGYGVQIGSFNDFKNVFDVTSKLDHACYVQLSQNQGEPLLYKVIVGEAGSRDQAEKIKSSLNKVFPGCFIVDLKTILQ